MPFHGVRTGYLEGQKDYFCQKLSDELYIIYYIYNIVFVTKIRADFGGEKG